MPVYRHHVADLQTAALSFRKDSRSLAAYEENYLHNLYQALEELKQVHGCFSLANRAALTRQFLDNYFFAEDFKRLRSNALLIQPVLDALFQNIRYSNKLTTAFLILKPNRLLTWPGIIPALTQNPDQASLLAQGLLALHDAGIFKTTHSILLRFPQLAPSLLLLQQNKLLNLDRLNELYHRRGTLAGLTAVFAELTLAENLNKDTYRQTLAASDSAITLSLAARELRLAGHLKTHFSLLLAKVQHSAALAEGVGHYNYAKVPLNENDLHLLFNFAPHAAALSRIMVSLSHLNLLETYRLALTAQAEQAETLLKIFEILQEHRLFSPENIAGVFSQAHRLTPLLQYCEAHQTFTQPLFNHILGTVKAENRLKLILGNASGNPSAFYFQPAPRDERQPMEIATASKPPTLNCSRL